MTSSIILQPQTCMWIVESLAHLLWQGTLIAGLVAIVAQGLRRHSAQLRYMVFYCALLLTVACMPFNLWMHAPVDTFGMAVAPDGTFTTEQVILSPSGDEEFDATIQVVEPSRAGFVDDKDTPVLVAQPVELPRRSTTIDRDWPAISRWIVAAYLSGVVLMSLRLLAGLYGSQKLRVKSKPVDDSKLCDILARFGERCRMGMLPVVAYSTRVSTPLVVGVLKPAILLPAAILNELTPGQVESLLLHELAHIRRYDHIANLLQRAIETLLFFHPAVWWLSLRVCTEREHCCDDLAIEWGSERCDYAESLVRLSELRLQSAGMGAHYAAVLAAIGNRPTRLRERVLRVLDVPLPGPSPGLTPRGLFFLVALMVSSTLIVAGSGGAKDGQQTRFATGQTFERWIGDDGDRESMCCLDFETGNVFQVPPEFWKTQPPGRTSPRWWALHGIDVIGDYATGLNGVSEPESTFDAMSIPNDMAGAWDEISTEDVMRALNELDTKRKLRKEQAAINTSIVSSAVNRVSDPQSKQHRDQEGFWIRREDNSEVHAFRTASGSVGILQIVQVDHQERRQKIRYKLLKPTEAGDTVVALQHKSLRPSLAWGIHPDTWRYEIHILTKYYSRTDGWEITGETNTPAAGTQPDWTVIGVRDPQQRETTTYHWDFKQQEFTRSIGYRSVYLPTFEGDDLEGYLQAYKDLPPESVRKRGRTEKLGREVIDFEVLSTARPYPYLFGMHDATNVHIFADVKTGLPIVIEGTSRIDVVSPSPEIRVWDLRLNAVDTSLFDAPSLPIDLDGEEAWRFTLPNSLWSSGEMFKFRVASDKGDSIITEADFRRDEVGREAILLRDGFVKLDTFLASNPGATISIEIAGEPPIMRTVFGRLQRQRGGNAVSVTGKPTGKSQNDWRLPVQDKPAWGKSVDGVRIALSPKQSLAWIADQPLRRMLTPLVKQEGSQHLLLATVQMPQSRLKVDGVLYQHPGQNIAGAAYLPSSMWIDRAEGIGPPIVLLNNQWRSVEDRTPLELDAGKHRVSYGWAGFYPDDGDPNQPDKDRPALLWSGEIEVEIGSGETAFEPNTQPRQVRFGGEASKNVPILLIPQRASWTQATPPVIKVEIRNDGEEWLVVPRTGEQLEIEVDGQWYTHRQGNVRSGSTTLGQSGSKAYRNLRLDGNWGHSWKPATPPGESGEGEGENTTDHPLRLSPGRHTVRVRITEDLITQPVDIEVVAKSEEETARKAILSDFDTRPEFLDLASGKMIAVSYEADNEHGATEEIRALQQGDLGVDGKLAVLRGGIISSWNGKTAKRLDADYNADANTKSYDLPIPSRVLVTTGDGKQFDVQVTRKTEDGGLEIEYQPIGVGASSVLPATGEVVAATGESKLRTTNTQLIGRWTGGGGIAPVEHTFAADGSYVREIPGEQAQRGMWRVEKNRLVRKLGRQERIVRIEWVDPNAFRIYEESGDSSMYHRIDEETGSAISDATTNRRTIGNVISRSIITPDGRPAAGAEIELATREKRIITRGGRFVGPKKRKGVLIADENGKFSLPPQEAKQLLLIVFHESGFAEVSGEQLDRGTPITLQPWGKIEGQVLKGNAPDGGHLVSYSPDQLETDLNDNFAQYSYETITDEQGRFQFDRVKPGQGQLYGMVKRDSDWIWQQPWRKRVAVGSKETTVTTVRRMGRPVSGRIALGRESDAKVDWRESSVAILRWDSQAGRYEEQPTRRAGLDDSRTFIIQDVPPGTYKLTMDAWPQNWSDGGVIGKLEREFSVPNVPGGFSDEPLKLGAITAQLIDALEPNEVSP